MDLIAAIGCTGAVCGVVFGYIGYRRGLLKDCRSDGKSSGVLMSEIGYIKSGIEDIKRKQEAADNNYIRLAIKQSSSEADVKALCQRMEALEQTIRI